MDISTFTGQAGAKAALLMNKNNTPSIVAIAANTYRLLEGREPIPELWSASRDYVSTMFPQTPVAASATNGVPGTSTLQSALTEFETKFHLAEEWRDQFDDSGLPISEQAAYEFLKQYIHLFANFPRTDHDILCRETIMQAGALIDVAIHYPLAADYYIFYLTVGGAGTVKTDAEEILLEHNSFILIPPTCSMTVSRANEVDSWHFYSGHFRPKSTWIDLIDWVHDFSRPQILTLNEDVSATLRRILSNVVDATLLPDALSERLRSNLIEQLLIRLRLCTSTRENLMDNRIAQAIGYALQNLKQDIDVQTAARFVHLSTTHFSSLFTHCMGVSFGKWRENARIEEAARLLRHTQNNIAEIAQSVGFSDQLYFSRRFKKVMGSSPTAFRERWSRQ